MPGLLRIVHTKFIHYEWYVPVDEDRYRYVQLFVEFKTGLAAVLAKFKYLTFVRWLFHGQFTGQDRWMVDVMDAPPERLYRPDVSITRWRALCESAPPNGLAICRGANGPTEPGDHAIRRAYVQTGPAASTTPTPARDRRCSSSIRRPAPGTSFGT